MRVQVDDALSESIKVKKRVPRGSFLGLFLFVLLIDDLSNDIVSFSSYLFTDDLFSLFLHTILAFQFAQCSIKNQLPLITLMRTADLLVNPRPP